MRVYNHTSHFLNFQMLVNREYQVNSAVPRDEEVSLDLAT